MERRGLSPLAKAWAPVLALIVTPLALAQYRRLRPPPQRWYIRLPDGALLWIVGFLGLPAIPASQSFHFSDSEISSTGGLFLLAVVPATLIQHLCAPGRENLRALRGAKRAILVGALVIAAGRMMLRA
jgi:hypothetical protein